ncbi:ABC-2 and Plant PDR ABC-type transporter family protein [Raphanus sativus]|uniref:ABC transporter G family member 42-like isoform X2 n=1 Tax=Raphanus sativus TaxID=3726 RepID=A0A6J0NF46_RAPSA|nr:ABC transporter G family member 42-like isoform X2 [Raphanus sativus]KAJ4900143.1 ABC-2 and Plant PDR ABC-type transporter family protein [Raphanus sativus]
MTTPQIAGDENGNVGDEEVRSQWAAIERLPTFERITTALFWNRDEQGRRNERRVRDVSKLEDLDRHLFIDDLIKHVEDDNLQLLQKVKNRIDEVGLELPTIEVRFSDLFVEAECEVVYGKPIPTLWNAIASRLSRVMCLKKEKNISILNGVSGIVRPKRMTLLLGPPSCGKTTLLLALAGRLDPSLKTTGNVSYNGHLLSEFVPEKTSNYVSQNDLHIPEITVRETLDFSGCFQGTGSRLETVKEISRREKLKGIVPDPDIDAYMKAASIEGSKTNLQTDYILKILGLSFCADTRVGDTSRPGISGGQKRRLTTGETIVGPIKTLFMDEISNGLDSSTTFQIVSCLQHYALLSEGTIVVSLLQPAPETFEIFDDVILMGEGKIIYIGPRDYICTFFEDCGFKCPTRKSVAEFLQEVISRKDQEQYWCHIDKPYCYVSIDSFIERFKKSELALQQQEELSKTHDKSQAQKEALCSRKYSLSNWEMLRACSRREFLLIKRNSFVYVFKSGLLICIGSIAMTVYLRTGSKRDVVHANYLMGSLFFSIFKMLADGLPELTLTISRLSVFYKQKELYFYPAWAYAVPSAILKIPISFLEAFMWTSLTYYVIGYSPDIGRFFRQFLIFFALHLSCISMFRAIAATFRDFVLATTIGTVSVVLLSLFGGFVLRKPSMPAWLQWGFWLSPLSYAEIGLTSNEFFSTRWSQTTSGNRTLGEEVLDARGLNFGDQSYWSAFAALIGLAFFFNIIFVLALTFLKASNRSRAIVSGDDNSQSSGNHNKSSSKVASQSKNALPFKPLTFTFQDVCYFVQTPQGKKVQLLSNVTGAFKPGVLTALMGVSGAGKTTLMDVLSGRKSRGDIEGEIQVGGYRKVQETFARVSGYCEQFDIHSPNLTIEESLEYSAWLRLPSTINSETKRAIVREVLETIELEGIKDSIVGLPGVSGLTTEQRKRLTIAVELVANPSIIFMDEPTTGLDARAAAIVMRAVKNITETGRTVVCTIHQPGTDIFEAFDELVLMKNGGRIIYHGPLGQHSSNVIEYFMRIPGVPEMKENTNPATWLLDITSRSSEDKLGVDLAQIYKESSLFKENNIVIEQMRGTSSETEELTSSTRYAQTGWEQFKACLWKQQLSYWRNPSYNLTRILFMCFTSVICGVLFWQKAKKIDTQQDLFNVLGSMYTVVLFTGMNNCSTVLFCIATERNVFYRERFSQMYNSWAYSLAQVLVEIPYSLVQSILCVIILYPMVGYYFSVYKVFWSFYAVFCTLLIYNYFGMLLVVITPNIHVAFTLRSAFYSMVNLFAGYVIPKPSIPKWWIWMYYLSPTSWVLNGLLTSQYGDMENEVIAFGERKKVSDFVEEYFGFRYDSLALVAIVLIAFPILLASLFAFFIGKLNFQKK